MSSFFSTNEAISQGNAMTNEAVQHNDQTRIRNQEVISNLNKETSDLEGQKRSDNLLHDVTDVYGVGNSIKSAYGTYAAAQKAGGLVKYAQGEGGLGNARKVFNSVGNNVKGKIYGSDVADPAPTPLQDTGNKVGTAAEAPVEPADVPKVPAAKSGVKAPVPGEEIPKPPRSAGELFEAAGETAGRVGAGLGVISAIGGITTDIEGGFGKMNTADKTSNIASIAAGALDVAAIFLPVLAPVAAVVSAVSAVSGGVGEIEDISSQETTDAANAKSNTGAIVPPTSLSSQGLVASQVTDNTKQITSSGAF